MRILFLGPASTRSRLQSMEDALKHGARNDIPAKVIEIKTGGVMAQVEVELEGTSYRMTSVMTRDSLDEPGLAEGATVHVVAKAVNLLLVKP